MGKKKIRSKRAWSPEKRLNRQILYFLGFVVLISWPPMIVSSLGQVNASGFTPVMFAPFLAALIATSLTRGVKKTGAVWMFEDSGIKWNFNFKKSARSYVMAYVLPLICSILGALLFFVCMQGTFSLDIWTILARNYGYSPAGYIARQTLIIFTISVIVAAVPAMGEEAGWRGFLMPRLVEKYGARLAIVISAFIWAIWQFPLLLLQWRPTDKIIALTDGTYAQAVSGYLYGTGYPGAPLTGLFAICVYSFALTTILWWIYCKSQSVWAASLAHGCISAVGMFALEFRNLNTVANWLLGPSLPGLISVLPLLACAVYLFLFRIHDMQVSSCLLEK